MNILVAEKRLNGARYYAATPITLVADITLTHRKWLDIEDWCYTNFGERPMNRWPDSGDRWFANDGAFWFRDEQDLMMFILRWT
jgi:hypothetical protein